MKKIVLIFFALFFCLGLNAQSADLYDVNFDEPRNIPSYNENAQVFQDIYLQYEDAIRRSEESIRGEEKNIRQDDIQKFQENLSQEQEKAQKNLVQALEKQKQEIYAKEIEQLRNDEREKLSAELHDVISKELTEKFTAEYEKKLKEASDKLAQEYNAKIAEIERQKESEMKAWRIENKKQALEETNARTERMRILTPYIVAVIAAVAIILLGQLLTKHKKELDERNQKIENYKAEYLNRLKRIGSNNIYRDEIKNIYEEIDASHKSDNEKTLRKKALQQAVKEFESSRETLTITEYKKKFDDLNPKRHFNTWNTLGDDIEAKKGIISDFSANIAEYEKYAISACNSKNDQTEIADMLKQYEPILKSNSEQLTALKDSESDESLKGQLSDLSDKYKKLADKFDKGKF